MLGLLVWLTVSFAGIPTMGADVFPKGDVPFELVRIFAEKATC